MLRIVQHVSTMLGVQYSTFRAACDMLELRTTLSCVQHTELSATYSEPAQHTPSPYNMLSSVTSDRGWAAASRES
jgi:hypothetical protein